MRIATPLTGTVLAAACLFGLSGLSSVANAAEPTAGTVVAASDTNIQASRHTDGSTSEPSLPPPEVRGAGQEAESSDSSGGSTRNDRPS